MSKRISKNLVSTGYRTFTYKHRGKAILVAWIQRRCKVCQRFLGKKEIFLCRKCYRNRQKSKRYLWDAVTKSIEGYSRESIKEVVDKFMPRYIWKILRKHM